jgi:hypothetical protein
MKKAGRILLWAFVILWVVPALVGLARGLLGVPSDEVAVRVTLYLVAYSTLILWRMRSKA